MLPMLTFPQSSAAVSAFLVDLLGEIIFHADFLDLVKLGFDPVDVLFLVDEDVLQQLAAGIVASR